MEGQDEAMVQTSVQTPEGATSESHHHLHQNGQQQPRPPPRIPRSVASIAFALDQLENDVESDDFDDYDDVSLLNKNQPTEPQSRDGTLEQAEDDDDDGNNNVEATPNLTAKRRQEAADALDSHPLDFVSQYPHIVIVTTAALPWLTGTAVNPALRAAYLWKAGHSVTFVIPWVDPVDQPRLFSEGVVFNSPQEQALAVVEAIQRRVPFPLPPHASRLVSSSIDHLNRSYHHGESRFRLVFYAGRYDPGLGSIMPEVDVQALIPRPVDLIILEEPEHLTWYHTGKRWTRAFPRNVPVVGIMHTNYVDYAKREAGEAAAGALKRLNKFLCRQHTHKVIKLSDAVQNLPRQETCFVHGVSNAFLSVGQTVRDKNGTDNNEDKIPLFSKGIYFLGKALWAKGFAELLDRFSEYRKQEKKGINTKELVIDVYGKGEQLDAIKAEANLRELTFLNFLGAKDHLSPDMAAYRAFVNPSTSDVVATTTAEAIAMGKWVVVPKHPCNVFFSTFSNCLLYDNEEEFARAVQTALTKDPAPLSIEEERRLTWEAATDRLLHCCASAEVWRGPPLARMVSKTGWVGYNVGYQVYAVANGVFDLIGKGRRGGGLSGTSPTSSSTMRNLESRPVDGLMEEESSVMSFVA